METEGFEVVDDDKLFLALISGILKKEGHTVIELNNGVEVLSQLSSNKIDILITDILMIQTNCVSAMLQSQLWIN